MDEDFCMNTETIAKMRHEVIDNTIMLEELFDDLIKIDMGFEPQYSGDNIKIPINAEEIKRFNVFFYDRVNFARKIEIILDIIKKGNFQIPIDFKENLDKLRKIRNDFAHTLAPKQIYQEGCIGISIKDYEKASKEIEGWKDKYLIHCKIFKEIYKIIYNHFYAKADID